MPDASNGQGGVQGITVVVPTYNCAHLLAMTLESLADQALDKARYEVIVVDDGSSDNTVAVVDAYRGRIDVHFRFQEDRGFRAAAARNLGMNQAKFQVILFLDAGMLVSSRTLALHVAAHRSLLPSAIIGLSYGVFEYTTDHADLLRKLTTFPVDASLQRMRSHTRLRDCREGFMRRIGFDLSRMSNPWLVFWSGHISVSTGTARSLGGFDEWFDTWGGEDVEFGLRWWKAGWPMSVLPTIESVHYPHAKDEAAKRASSRRNLAYIHEKHRCRDVERLMSENWEEVATTNVTARPSSCG
ncbi:glycosyltransferase family 2 protein [Xanthomonas sp. NCPPB 2632]|uniref:glycosyltransferase family 2 protein n=1 Tax=Xanthomonas sp. NCPPB 2632 TaxID=3240912 RepID=UPI003516B02B